MKIHNRFLLFLVLSIAVYALALHALRAGTARISSMLLNGERRDVATHLSQILDLERAPMEKGIFDNTFWDDMVAFVRHPRPEWAKENIELGFPNFGLQFVWVYDPDLRLVYSMPPATTADPDEARLPPGQLREALAAGWFRHFFERPSGEMPIEYFTAPIQPSADNERRTPPQGFLVGARRLDRAYTDRLSGIAGSAVSLEPWPAEASPADHADQATATIEVFVPVADRRGAPLAALRAHQVNEGLQHLRASLGNYNALYLAFAIANLGLLAVFIFAWVKIPLQRISESLDRHDLAPVSRYLDARHEFGTLARLIRSFFQQREALVTELEMRKQYEAHLREARDLADRAAHAKADFLSVMSHELRTPLNAVIGLATLLLDERPRPDQVENLTALKVAAENLLVLINDVLDFNKMEAGKLILEQRDVDLRRLLADLVRSFQPQAQAKGLSLTAAAAPDVPPLVIGDPLRVSQVLGNLLSNAIKFTDHGGIALAADLASEAGVRVRIAFRVADTGIGIAVEDQSQIFELFTQADSDTTRRYGGTGLGLPIVSKLLALMGSVIEVDSTPGQGSTFRFVLEFARAPMARAERAAARPVAAAAGRAEVAGRRVLVVEDNAVNRELAVTFLRRWGCSVDTAEDGLVALEKAAARPYDLILMDLQMPQMSGIEATSRIRRNLRGPNARTIIIAFTATNPEDNLADVEAAGFDDYIAKPIDPDRLRETLERALAKMMRPVRTRAG
jgi:signal transduction histidine kinase/ActR/RegA family two-component response regulator